MMNVKIGEKIKELRKRDGVTQERLAEALGVTSQAVSKWESESGYPDIEYITPLANFFNVATDYLFSHDVSEKREKIEEYCRRCDIYSRNCPSARERIDIMRQALAEFPAEEKLLFLLAEALYDKWKVFPLGKKKDGYYVHDENDEKYKAEGWKEPAAVFERLLASSVDDSIRTKCRWYLAMLYGRTGDKEKVIKIAETFDPVNRSREVLLAEVTRVTRGSKENEKYRQEAVIALFYALEAIITNVAVDKNNFTDKDNPLRDYIMFEAHDIMIDIWTRINKFVFKNDGHDKIDKTIVNLYCLCAYELITENEIDEAYIKLEEAYKYAYNKIELLQYLLERIKSEKDSIRIPYDPQLRDDPRFTDLIRKIEADIAE